MPLSAKNAGIFAYQLPKVYQPTPTPQKNREMTPMYVATKNPTPPYASGIANVSK